MRLIRTGAYPFWAYGFVGALVGATTIVDWRLGLLAFGVVVLGLLLALDFSALFLLFLLTIFVDRSPVSVHGTYVRLYMLLAAVLVARWLPSRSRIRWHPVLTVILLWWLTYFLAIIRAPSLIDFWKVVGGEAFLVTVAVFVVSYLSTQTEYYRRRAISFVVYGGLIVVASGYLQLAGAPLFHLSVQQVSGFVRPFGLMREADWYGTVCAYTGLLLTWVLLFARIDIVSARVAWWGLVASTLGNGLSLSRASWLAFGVGLLVLLAARHRQRPLMNYSVVGILTVVGSVLLLSGLAVALMSPATVHEIWVRINPATVLTANANAGYSHVYAIDLMIYLIRAHPLTGWGAGAMAVFSQNRGFDLMFAGGGQINSGSGSANVLLNQWVESGAIGLALLLAWIVMLFKMKVSRDGWVFKVVLGALLVNFLFSNGIDFGFVWVTVALILSHGVAPVSRVEKG